jgi:SAM-dependent methyltransferase
MCYLQTVSTLKETKAAGRPRLLPGLSVRDGYMAHPFDLKYGVRTSGLIAGRNLKNGHRHDRHNTAYYGVAPSVFERLLARWLRNHPTAPIEEFTFIDLGAGMGRALLLASLHPFRQVIGVELHPTLARIAQKNLTRWRAASLAQAPMRMVCSDAIDFEYPAGPCLVFLFNPFAAPVMRRLLSDCRRTFAVRAGQLDILYVNNEQESEFERQRGFARLFSGKVMRSRDDTVADKAILNNQPDGEYTSSNYEDCSIWRWLGSARKA